MLFLLQLNEHIFHLNAGDAFLIPAGKVSYYEASKEDPWCYTWINFMGINSQMFQGTPTSQYLQANGIHPNYLTRIFHERYGTSPKQYLMDLKLKKASRLLATTKLNISIIANSLGFDDQLSFSKYFKKKFAVSPSEYRKQRTLYSNNPNSNDIND